MHDGDNAPTTSVPVHDDVGRLRWLVATLALLSLPFLAVRFVPGVDLPQHVAQVRLLEELWHLREPTVDLALLEVRPFGANTLVYWPMFLLGRAIDPRLVGKLMTWLILAASVLAVHHLARRRTRDPLYAHLCVLTLFSTTLYWGLLNFSCGLPLWLCFVARALDASEAPTQSWRAQLGDAALVCALYWAHVFWVAAALATMVVIAFSKPRLRANAQRAVIFVPALILGLLWYPELASSRRSAGFDVVARYQVPISDRLSWGWLVETLFGGVRGWAEPIATGALLFFVAFGLARSARDHCWKGDLQLALVGALLAAFALLAPDKYLNTLFFNTRFLPVAMSLLLLSLPPLPERALRYGAVLATASFLLFTAFTWSLFEQDDLSGLETSVADKPVGASTMGLNYRTESPYLRGSPFLQVAAYAQAFRGGELSFSFAEHSSSIVTFRRPRVQRWTPGIEWLPERATLADLAQFDCIIVNGDEPTHAQFLRTSGRKTTRGEGHFRLYR